MYELLLAEISAQNGDASSAYQLMLDAAQKSRSDQLYERAVEIALRARAGESALQAAQSWARTNPTSESANRYLLQILVGLNKLPDMVEPIKRALASLQPKERAAAIGQLPRYFVRVTDKKQAAKVLEQALAPELNNPGTGPAAYATIGNMHILDGNNEAALEAAKKGHALNRKAEEPVLLAIALIDPKLPAAEALVSNSLQAGARPELHMAYLRKLLDAQRLDHAAAETVKINAASPDFADAWLVRGSLALQQKDLVQAQTALSQFVKLRLLADSASNTETAADQGLMQAYFLLADIADQNGKPDEAQHYLGLIDSPQDALRVQVRRANMLARQGKLAEARALIRSAPEMQSDDARAKISAEAQLLRDNKQFVQVYDFLTEAVQRAPADVDLRYDLAMAAEKLDKIDEMETLLRQVIKDKPDYHHAYNALGYSLADRNLRLPEARQLVQKALEFAPNDPFILDSLGWVEFRSGNLGQALQILQGAFQTRPDAEIAAHLIEVLWDLGKKDEARTVWKAAAAQSPDNDTLRQTTKRLGLP
ncbi:MAG: tetratricopeptide repeat protein [Rhodoferax sp.]|nr:tetratricopeptide repeat protein [Rhodoferax sp.]